MLPKSLKIWNGFYGTCLRPCLDDNNFAGKGKCFPLCLNNSSMFIRQHRENDPRAYGSTKKRLNPCSVHARTVGGDGIFAIERSLQLQAEKSLQKNWKV